MASNCAGALPVSFTTWHWPLEWDEAEAAGVYLRSTGARAWSRWDSSTPAGAHQLAATYQRFYADAGAVRLLTIDP